VVARDEGREGAALAGAGVALVPPGDVVAGAWGAGAAVPPRDGAGLAAAGAGEAG
jgi:hypothetical protein